MCRLRGGKNVSTVPDLDNANVGNCKVYFTLCLWHGVFLFMERKGGENGRESF